MEEKVEDWSDESLYEELRRRMKEKNEEEMVKGK